MHHIFGMRPQNVAKYVDAMFQKDKDSLSVVANGPCRKSAAVGCSELHRGGTIEWLSLIHTYIRAFVHTCIHHIISFMQHHA